MYQQRAVSGVGATSIVCRQCLFRRPVARPVSQRTRARYICQASRSNSGSFTQDKTRSQQGSSDSRQKETIQERAQAVGQVASERVKRTYQAVEGGVKQAARSVDSRFDFRGKAQQTKDRVVQQLEEVDDKFQLRQKARVTLADAQRQLPRWRRQYGAFSKTLPGKVLWFAFLVWGFRSGLFFKLLNLAGLLFLLAPLVIVPLAQALTKRAAAAQAAQQAQQMKQQQQAQNPFSRFGGFGNMRAQQQQQQQESTSKKSPYAQQDGPIIDAEWTTIDEGDQ